MLSKIVKRLQTQIWASVFGSISGKNKSWQQAFIVIKFINKFIVYIKGGDNMYGEWMDKISLEITEEDLTKYKEDKKKN